MLGETKTERQPLQIGWAVPAAGPVRTRWEYLSLYTDANAETVTDVRGAAPQIGKDISISDALDTLGADDWELVAVAPRPPGGLLCLFKRPHDKRS